MKKLLALAVLVLCAGGSLAQTTDDAQPAEPDPSAAATVAEPAPPAQADGGVDDGATQPDEQEANTQARFIPTEQISQDLGVSFPVDI